MQGATTQKLEFSNGNSIKWCVDRIQNLFDAKNVFRTTGYEKNDFAKMNSSRTRSDILGNDVDFVDELNLIVKDVQN